MAYASTGGFAGGFRVSSFALSVTPVASDDGDMERDYWYTSARHLADLQAPEEIGREAARRAVRRLGGRKGQTTEVPVVFDPETAASLIRGLAVAASGPSLYRGTSFLDRPAREDRGVAPGHDRRRSPDAAGPRIPAVRRRGPAEPADGAGGSRGPLGATSSTPTAPGGSASTATGHRRPRGRGRRDGRATRTSTSSPGPGRPRRSSGSVDRGLYVTELIGFGVNFVTGDYSRGAVGFWIEGRRAHVPRRGDHHRRQPAADAAGRRDGRARPRPSGTRPQRRR